MPITSEDLTRMSKEELLALFQPSKCMTCGVTLHETMTGCRKVEGGCVCSECYFRDFSDELEQHPICVPRMHRGG